MLIMLNPLPHFCVQDNHKILCFYVDYVKTNLVQDLNVDKRGRGEFRRLFKTSRCVAFHVFMDSTRSKLGND